MAGKEVQGADIGRGDCRVVPGGLAAGVAARRLAGQSEKDIV